MTSYFSPKSGVQINATIEYVQKEIELMFLSTVPQLWKMCCVALRRRYIDLSNEKQHIFLHKILKKIAKYFLLESLHFSFNERFLLMNQSLNTFLQF